jgi:hypothetical protein
VTVTVKDMSCMVRWVTPDPTYHSVLVRTSITAVNSSIHSVASIRD